MAKINLSKLPVFPIAIPYQQHVINQIMKEGTFIICIILACLEAKGQCHLKCLAKKKEKDKDKNLTYLLVIRHFSSKSKHCTTIMLSHVGLFSDLYLSVNY